MEGIISWQILPWPPLSCTPHGPKGPINQNPIQLITHSPFHIFYSLLSAQQSFVSMWTCGDWSRNFFVFELSGVWRTADISRSLLTHRSIPIIVKAIVNVALSHYQLCMWLLQKLWPASASYWWQIWCFNHTVIVCPVRFFFCIMWGQNKRTNVYREKIFTLPP